MINQAWTGTPSLIQVEKTGTGRIRIEYAHLEYYEGLGFTACTSYGDPTTGPGIAAANDAYWRDFLTYANAPDAAQMAAITYPYGEPASNTQPQAIYALDGTDFSVQWTKRMHLPGSISAGAFIFKISGTGYENATFTPIESSPTMVMNISEAHLQNVSTATAEGTCAYNSGLGGIQIDIPRVTWAPTTTFPVTEV